MSNAKEGRIEPAPSAIQLFEDGHREFVAGRFFEAHDIWEEFWHRLHGPDRRYLQGLIHLAVGAYHFENENHAGARSQWSKAAIKLGEYPEGHWGVDRREWIAWIRSYIETKPHGPFPGGLPFERDQFPQSLRLALD